MLLLLDALETGNLTHVRRIEHAYIVFRELQDNGVHKLASLAVEKLSWGLDQLRKRIGENHKHRPGDKVDATTSSYSEAYGLRDGSHDAVMHNSGMLILEDQGLQSYTVERFAPFTCAGTEAVSEATTLSQLKQDQDSQFYGFSSPLADMTTNRSDEIVPISKELWHSAGPSSKSVLGPNCAPPSHKLSQSPSCVTGPASPVSPGASVLEQTHGTSLHPEHRQQRKVPGLQYPKSHRNSPPKA